MAKSASKTSSELSALHFDRKLTQAVKDCASACGKSSVSNKAAESAKQKAQEELLKQNYILLMMLISMEPMKLL